MEENNSTEEIKSSGNLRLYLPQNGRLINIDSDEEVTVITQKKFRKEGLNSWIIWTKGD